MIGLKCSKETYSFDAKLTDSMGRAVSVDCTVQVPNIWGQEVEISLAIPHVEMPIRSIKNPCVLSAEYIESDFSIEMNEVWYRHLPGAVFPARKFGASAITMTHVADMCLTEGIQCSDNKFFVCISHADFLSESTISIPGEEMIESIASFSCPKLGNITLQRYWAKSRLESSESFVLNSGFWLEIPINENKYTVNEILSFVAPILDILSIFFRQRVLVLGWESYRNGVRKRFYKNPIQPLQTSYVSVEPKRYLVLINKLSEQVNTAISAYYNLGQRERKFIFSLSYSLCPAISLRDGERFMALFRELESIAAKCSKRKPMTDAERSVVQELENIANSIQESSHDVCDRLRGFARKISGGMPPLATSILDFLRSNNVVVSDLWGIEGDRGLVGIRNKLAHRGSHYVHHQGLAVATFHLSILSERVVYSVLGLYFNNGVHTFRRDDWLQMEYVNALKERIFDVSIA